VLAGALGETARHLRWDVEEDLSRIAGDALARRIGGAVESGRTTALDLRSRLESSAIGYLAGDGGQLIAGGRLAALRAGIDGLEDRVARIEARVRAGGGGPLPGAAR